MEDILSKLGDGKGLEGLDFGALTTMAKKLADDIPDSEKKNLQNMDFNQMFSTVFQNLMKSGAKIPVSSDPLVNDRFAEDDDDVDDDSPIVQKSKDLHYNLNVKLEDLYRGKQKKISFSRKRTNDKNETFSEKKKIIINITPGMKDGDVIEFKGEADQLPGQAAGDVIITICEDDHEVFDREGDNLFLVKDVSLSELYSLDFTLTHMDGRVLHVVSKENDVLHTNDGIRKIVGEGMPIGDGGKGDLFIRFNLILPDKLESKDIETLKLITPPINIYQDTDGQVESHLEIVTEEDMEKLEESEYNSSEEDYSDDEEEEEEDDENSDNEDSSDE